MAVVDIKTENAPSSKPVPIIQADTKTTNPSMTTSLKLDIAFHSFDA